MKKTILSLILVVTMLSIPAGLVFGAEADSTQPTVDELILYTKDFFDIGAEYDQFDYTFTQGENGTVWNLNWINSSDETNASVSIDNDKYVQSYSRDIPREKRQGLASLTKEQAEKTAEEFLKKVVPEEYVDGFRPDDNINAKNIYSQGDIISFTYSYYVNDVPYNGSNISIDVSKYTNEVVYYSAIDKNVFTAGFPAAENVISEDKAKDIFKENSTMLFRYKEGTEPDTDKPYVYSYYYLDRKDMPYAADAVTGKIIDPNDDADGAFASGSTNSLAVAEDAEEAAFDTAAEKEAPTLSEAEIASIKDKQKLITPQQALETVGRIYDIQDKTGLSTGLSTYGSENKYIWQINITNSTTNIIASIDAENGRLISFNNLNSYYVENGGRADYDAMATETEDLLSKLEPDKISSLTLDYREDKSWNEDEIYSYTFLYNRTENNVQSESEYIEFVFTNEGKLSYYNCRWNEDIKYPSVSDAIGEDKAYDIMLDINAPCLCYIKLNNEIRLVYLYNTSNIYLDKLGNRITYSGQPYKKNESFGGYTDIAGTRYEDIINTLYNNGYYINRAEFKPTEAVSTEDFKELFKLDTYEPRPLVTADGAEKANEGTTFSFTGEKVFGDTLTRYEAAEIVASLKVGHEIGEKTEIFADDLYKEPIDEYYRGYVAICKGFGYMSGDQNGLFNGDKKITNEEAAVILYNYLTK